MRIFLFGAESGTMISHFGSEHARLTRGVRTEATTVVGCLHLGPSGFLGRHPASVSQLLMVIAGEGWVEGGDGRRVRIQVGQAAFWTAGEQHTTGTDHGLAAVIVEAAGLDPARFMAEVEPLPMT